ncbi:Uncharacterized protein Fot_15123 [Forsythia ovata]|uniref:Uncharacterized protein n=1 Tax=Forsythia ovata TaxID=205694 RepID=A0ABD1W8S8_9LAMI
MAAVSEMGKNSLQTIHHKSGTASANKGSQIITNNHSSNKSIKQPSSNVPIHASNFRFPQHKQIRQFGTSLAKSIVEVAGSRFSSPAAKCKKDGRFTNYEPISVLDTRSPSPSTSTSTFSSFNNTTQQGDVTIAAAAHGESMVEGKLTLFLEVFSNLSQFFQETVDFLLNKSNSNHDLQNCATFTPK